MNTPLTLAHRSRHLDRSIWRLLLLVLLVSVGGLGCLPSGQRLLHFELSDGQVVVATAWRGVPDTTPVARMWAELPTLEWKVTPNTLSSSEQDILEINLQPSIRVEVKHTDNLLGRVTIESIILRRRSANEPWQITEESFERILKEIHR